MIADLPSSTNQALDHLRRRLAKDRNMIPKDQYDFLWVTDFPLFDWDPEENTTDEHAPSVHLPSRRRHASS